MKQSTWNPRSTEASLPFDKFGLKSKGLPKISVLSWEAYILRFPLPPSSCWTGKWVSSLIPPKTLLRRHMCMCGRFLHCGGAEVTSQPKDHSGLRGSPSSLLAMLALPHRVPRLLLSCPPPLPPGLTWEPHRAAGPMELPVPALDAQAQLISAQGRAYALQVAVEVIKQMIFLLWISSARFVPDMWCPLPFFFLF